MTTIIIYGNIYPTTSINYIINLKERLTMTNNNINIIPINHNQYLPNYKQHLILLSKSINTINSYLSDLNQYFSLYSLITRNNVQYYKAHISNLASTSFNRKLSSIKQYNEYLLSENLIDEVLVYKQDFIRIQDSGNPTNISEKTVLEFLQNVNNKYCLFRTRNIAIIYLMANTGIRREECCNMMLSHIIDNKRLIFKGKGNKERKVALTKRAQEVINLYLIDRAKSKYADSEYLFLSERGNKLRKESINAIFDFYSTNECKVKPHDLRHNFCSTMIEKGILTPKEVQNQAGHSSILTTDRYVHARMESIEEKIREYSIG